MKFKLTSLVMAIIICLPMVPTTVAYAASASDWSAGRIIDDSVFTNQNSMSIVDIQNFLNQKVGTGGGNGTPGQCDTNGIKTSELGGGTRAQYGSAHNNPIPFTCLKDYYEVPKLSPGSGIPASNYGGVAIPSGAKSAANLIYDAAQTYHISPKVLLITIQKESAGPLITDDWPFKSQYTYAMGAHCPDSGPGGSANCDPNYSGFSIQISESAALLRYYLDNMTQPWWPYKKVGINNIQYNPNTSCGSTAVNITSSATAALYTYTPYQPNTAALNNLYGTGDACSAYGNRNFWRMYIDWFGTTVGDLVRTVDNATVYLISSDNKYPIADGSVLGDFSALGPIRYVTNDYVNAKTTGPLLGHMVGDSNGTLYFVNAGIKLSMSSCAMVTDVGYSCGQVITLTDGQLSLLATGPPMTLLYGTTSGKQFYLSGGQKREVFDQQSLVDAGITGGSNTLLESGINYLPQGLPVIREKVVAISRFNGYQYFYENNKFNYLAPDISNLSVFASSHHAYLDDGSMPFSHRFMDFKGFVKNAASSLFYALDSTGKALLSTPTDWATSYTIFSDSMLASIANSTQIINNGIVKSPSNGTVYLVSGGAKRPFTSWADLVSMQLSPFTINSLRTTTIDAIPAGAIALGPGRLVKYSNNATVYLVDGLSSIVPVSNITVVQELGLAAGLSTVSSTTLDWYTALPTVQTVRVQCGAKNYLASGGVLYEITGSMQVNYGLSYTALNALTCANTVKSSVELDRFLHVPDGTIYYIESGLKRPIVGYAKYLELGGSGSNTTSVSNFAASQIPTGAVVN